MNSMTNDLTGLAAFVVAVTAFAGLWSATAAAESITKARHLIAVCKPMSSAYQVKTINGFDRRPSEGST